MGSRKYTWKTAILEICMLLLSLVIVIPLLVVLFGSFKTSSEAARYNFRPPEVWLFDNYLQVIEKAHL